MPKEGEVERRSFFLPSFHILSCETLFLRGFKGDDDTILANNSSEASRRI